MGVTLDPGGRGVSINPGREYLGVLGFTGVVSLRWSCNWPALFSFILLDAFSESVAQNRGLELPGRLKCCFSPFCLLDNVKAGTRSLTSRPGFQR